MRLPVPFSLPFLAASSAITAYVPDRLLQSQLRLPVDTPRPWRLWNEPVDQDATGNLIFQSLYSLMQMLPNSRYPNGHSIVRATIPTGTLLYHGRGSNVAPGHEQDWIAFDLEHSFFFAHGDSGHLFTLATTRPLNLIYFDGSSGNKIGGVIDTQDLLIWGDIGHENGSRGNERARLADACEWGKPYGIDGFVRMEMDFEIMYCDFTEGLRVVSSVNIIPTNRGGPGGPNGPERDEPSKDELSGENPLGPPNRGGGGPGRSPNTIPDGWKGSLVGSKLNEVSHAGSWHNWFPGDLRVRVEPWTMVTLFDPAYTSLIPSRRALPRDEWRLTNMSEADITRARAHLAEAMGSHEHSGVDWLGLAQTITQRFEDRLPLLRFLLHQPHANASAQATAVRQHLSVSLLPYMPRADVGTPAWFATIAGGCAASFASHLPEERFTRQERVLRDAFEEVLHEICRVLGQAWEEAFDVEEQSVAVAEERLVYWRDSIDRLIDWLDWPMWNICEPACGIDEICYMPQNRSPFNHGGSTSKQQEHPYCVSLLTGD